MQKITTDQFLKNFQRSLEKLKYFQENTEELTTFMESTLNIIVEPQPAADVLQDIHEMCLEYSLIHACRFLPTLFPARRVIFKAGKLTI